MIHYICGYAQDYGENKRKYSPAGVAKMEYIINCLEELNTDYRVYSTCQTVEPRWCKKQIRNHVTYRASFATSNKYTFHIDRIFAILQLIFYLVRIPRKDTVLVYHERFYTRWVNLIHGLKRWELVYEIEEIYTMVHGNLKKEVDKEIAGLRSGGSDMGYILATDLLKKYFQGEAVICNGAYHPIYFDSEKCEKTEGKIHVVYGGTLNQTKGGAAAAAAAAAYLPDRYHVHILGFGSNEQIAAIKELVNRINSKSKATVTYDGVLQGSAYRDFLQGCDIGLSAQNPGLAYNDTSFPSKVLEYLRNGLNVVSIDIPAVRQSAVSPLITFYENQTPEELSRAIQKAELHSAGEIKGTLDELHLNFKMDLAGLLKI